MLNKIGIIGLGTVGSALVKILINKSYEDKLIINDIDMNKINQFENIEYKSNALDIINNPEVGIIIEAIDDSKKGFDYALKALTLNKIYITANKRALAENLKELDLVLSQSDGKLLYEAAVGGTIPIIKTIKNHFKDQDIIKIRGILNGSSNYILTKINNDNYDFDKALKEAQDKGFAETDPSLDIDGSDILYKSILINYAVKGTVLDWTKIQKQGIDKDSEKLSKIPSNFKLKLTSTIDYNSENYIKIEPSIITSDDALYSIDYETNAVEITGEYSGKVILQGAGAGAFPTASALFSDLNDIIIN